MGVSGLKNNKYPPSGTAPALGPTNERIGKLYELGENWNGYGVRAPKSQAIEHALSWIREAHATATRNSLDWLSPHVTAGEEGNVVFEWWKGEKKLTIYVSPVDISFVKVWGTNINTEMAEGNITNSKDFHSVWSWILE